MSELNEIVHSTSENGRVERSIRMETCSSAADLPGEWDAFCSDNYALQRRFLVRMEEVNPCSQEYRIFRDEDGNIDSVLMTMEMEGFNLSMFTPFEFRVDLTLIYVPLSVAKPGFKIGNSTKREVESFLRSIKGYSLVLNVGKDFSLRGFAKGATCSNIVLCAKHSSFDEYLDSLRSPYRRRYRQAIRKGELLEFRILGDNRDFSDDHYALYEQVYAKSRIRVEKLSVEYFRSPNFVVMECRYAGKPVGFTQLIENGNELVFAFIGIDYAYNEKLDTYVNILLKIVEYAVSRGFSRIDLGQTADEAKLRLGGKYSHLYVLLRHSNPVVNTFLKSIVKLIEYKPLKRNFRVFKEERA